MVLSKAYHTRAFGDGRPSSGCLSWAACRRRKRWWGRSAARSHSTGTPKVGTRKINPKETHPAARQPARRSSRLAIGKAYSCQPPPPFPRGRWRPVTGRSGSTRVQTRSRSEQKGAMLLMCRARAGLSAELTERREREIAGRHRRLPRGTANAAAATLREERRLSRGQSAECTRWPPGRPETGPHPPTESVKEKREICGGPTGTSAVH